MSNYFNEEGERVPEADSDDRSGEALIRKYCADFAVSEEVAIENIAWMEENVAPAPAAQRPSSGYSALQKEVTLEKIFRFLITTENLWLTVRMMAYALGLDDVTGYLKPADFAKKGDMSRFNPTKHLEDIQKFLGVPPREGQKSPEARQKMREARLKQLEPGIAPQRRGDAEQK